MSRSDREAYPDVWVWSGVVGRPSRKSGIGLEALPDVQEWSGMVGSPSWTSGCGRETLPMSESAREALLDVQER